MRSMLNESFERASVLLNKYRRQLDLLAVALLEYEELDVDEIKLVMDGKPLSRKPAKAAAEADISPIPDSSNPLPGNVVNVS